MSMREIKNKCKYSLTHSTLEYFEKSTFQRKLKNNFELPNLRNYDKLKVQTCIFLKFHWIFFKTTLFSARRTPVGTRQVALPLKTTGNDVTNLQGSKD